MGPHGYSDPIVIPVTITIPDPRPRLASGRWDLDTPQHPSFADPGWFQRQDTPVVQARSGNAPSYGPSPLPFPGPLPMPALDEVGRDIERAHRRARNAVEEIERGEYGAAAGQLLLGRPFPAEVDDPLGAIVRNEGAEPPLRSPELDAKVAKGRKDAEARLAGALDEKHREAAERDRKGDPATVDGKS